MSDRNEELTDLLDMLERKPDEVGVEFLRVALMHVVEHILDPPAASSATEEALRLRLGDALRRAEAAEAEVIQLRARLMVHGAAESLRVQSALESLAPALDGPLSRDGSPSLALLHAQTMQKAL
ncbi:MAG: hypothetical protein ACRDQZ_09705 [Mycobacteriales bacterium]